MLRRFVSGVGAAIGRTEATATASAAHSKSGRTGPSTSPGSSQTRMCAPPGLADLRPRPSPADGRAPQQLPSDSTAVPRTQAIQRNRADLSSWFAALKAQDSAWTANTNLTTGLTNLIPPTQLLRFDKNPYLPNCPEMPGGYSAAKSFVDADQHRLHPADATRVPCAEDPYSQGHLVLSHVAQDHSKGNSPLSSTTDDDATHAEFRELLSRSFGAGSAMTVDSSKADVIPPRLAVAMMLFNASEVAHESKPWDWRNDPHLKLDPASPAAHEHLAEAMIKHGIDPDASKFSRAEKMSVFVLACGEHLIVGPTEAGAVKPPAEPGPAQS